MLGFHSLGSTPLGSNSPLDLLYASVSQTTEGVLLSMEAKVEANAAYLDLTLNDATSLSAGGSYIVGVNPNITLTDTTPVFTERNLIRTTDFSSFTTSTGIQRPTGWGRIGSLEYENQGVGEDEHGRYWQVRIFGTATASTQRLIFHVSPSFYVPAAPGDTFSGQFGAKLISHGGAVSSVVLSVASRSATNGQLEEFSASRSVSLLVSQGFFKFERTGTFTHPDTARVGLEMRLSGIVAGETTDFVIRIYTPQLEYGSTVTPFQETGPTAIPSSTAIVAETPVNANLILNSGAALSTGTAEVAHDARLERDLGSAFSTGVAEIGVATSLGLTLDAPSYTIEALNIFQGDLNVSLSGVYGRVNLIADSSNFGGWSSWWKKPAYREGDADPFGGTEAISYPLSECTGGPSGEAAGFIAWADSDIEIDQTGSVWLRGDQPMWVGLSIRGSYGYAPFLITTEWQRYHVTSPGNPSQSFPTRLLQIQLSYSGDNAALPPETRLYIAAPQTNYGSAPLDYVRTTGDGSTAPIAVGQNIVGLTFDQTTGAAAFVSVSYVATDATVDQTTGLAILASQVSPTITLIAANSTGAATSQATVGASVQGQVNKSADAAQPNASASVAATGSFSQSSNPATVQASGGPLGQVALEGTLGNVSAVALATTPISTNLTITTTSPLLASLAQISIVGQGSVETLPVIILAEAGPVILAALESGLSAAQIVAVAGPVVDMALDVLTDAASLNADGEPVGTGSLGVELASVIVSALLDNVVQAASVRSLSDALHTALGTVTVTSTMVSATQAAEIESMLYRVVRRVLMTPRTLRASTEKPMAGFTPTYS